MQSRTRIAAALTAAAMFGGATNAFASGFEKSVPFSGEVGGIVGAGASLDTGAESLFFNPAALAGSETGKIGLDLNFSPTLLQSSGDFAVSPTATPVAVDSGNMFSPFFGGFASYGLTERLGLGLGAYIAGGSNIEITGIDALGGTLFDDGRLASQLTILETSLGLGYEIVDGLEFGAAYRLALVTGEFASLSVPAGTNDQVLVQTQFSDLSDTQHGFRAGLRYAPKDSGWGVGAMYRSEIDFTVEGIASGQAQTTGAAPIFGSCVASACSLTPATATLSSSFPEQFNVGAFYDVSSSLRTVLEFSFTRYAVNQQITPTGTLEVDAATPGPVTEIDLADAPIDLGWQNQLQGKIGFIYTGMTDWTWRLGYSHVSQVVAAENARPTFTAPGPANFFSLGAGTVFGSIGVNAAYELTLLSGEGTLSADTAGQVSGDLSQNAHALHLGMTMSI